MIFRFINDVTNDRIAFILKGEQDSLVYIYAIFSLPFYVLTDTWGGFHFMDIANSTELNMQVHTYLWQTSFKPLG